MMRLRIIITTTLCFLVLSSYAQSNLTDSLNRLYNGYFKLVEGNQHLSDSLQMLNKTIYGVDEKVSSMNKTFNNVDSKLERITNDLSTSLEKVNRITKNDLLTKQARLNTQKDKILMTSIFIKSANNSFDAIDAALAQSDYLGDVASLNSPTNTDLGFSLSDEITGLVKTKIIKNNRKFNGSNSKKFLDFVQQIIKSPVVTSITNSVPALSSLNSIVSLVSNISVKEKGVSINDYIEFKKEVQRYFVHYEALGKANYDFNSNIDKLKVKTDALRVLLTNFTTERIKTIVPNEQLATDMPLHRMISQYYEYYDLQKTIDEILKEHRSGSRINYSSALNEEKLDYPFYAFNQAQFIQQELEAITTEYISTYVRYHKNIKSALEKSKSISKTPKKVDTKIADLEKKLTKLISTFEKNVKIREVNKNLQRIPTL